MAAEEGIPAHQSESGGAHGTGRGHPQIAFRLCKGVGGIEVKLAGSDLGRLESASVTRPERSLSGHAT